MINKVVVFGAGYVGLSSAVLISKFVPTTVIDIDKKKISLLKKYISPISEPLIQKYLDNKPINLDFKNKTNNLFEETDLVVLALPTNFNNEVNTFDTSILEEVIEDIASKTNKVDIVIKSTVPIGFSKKMQEKYEKLNIIFVPEFLREGNSIKDNIYPDRIILSSQKPISNDLRKLFLKYTKNTPSILFMSTCEAEAVKLFSNSFLATKVSYFNELDSFCLEKKLNAKKVVEGVCSDRRIGNVYNNPSFGYGGYCLPKDTKQLLTDFTGIPQNLFSAIVASNKTRKEFLVKKILEKNPKKIGIYRLIMKEGSDNFRESSIIDVMNILNKNNLEIFIYEPFIKTDYFLNYKVLRSFKNFVDESDIILTNRMDNKINKKSAKVFTRDIFGTN